MEICRPSAQQDTYTDTDSVDSEEEYSLQEEHPSLSMQPQQQEQEQDQSEIQPLTQPPMMQLQPVDLLATVSSTSSYFIYPTLSLDDFDIPVIPGYSNTINSASIPTTTIAIASSSSATQDDTLYPTTAAYIKPSMRLHSAEQELQPIVYQQHQTKQQHKQQQKQQEQTIVQQGDLPECIVHRLNRFDTLHTLAINYGIQIDEIKKVNNIISNDLGFFGQDEILIPNPKQLPKSAPTESVEDFAEKKRAMALQFFTRMKGVTEEVATYYLSLYDYNIKLAVIEYDEDVAWEKENKKLKERKRARRGAQKKWKKSMLRNHPLIRNTLQKFTLCFPQLELVLDPYGNLELDQFPDDNDTNNDVLHEDDDNNYDHRNHHGDGGMRMALMVNCDD